MDYLRLGWSGKGKNRSFYVYKSAYVNGKQKTVIAEKLGNTKTICEKYGVNDAEAWCREYIASLNEKSKEDKGDVTVRLSPSKIIEEGQQNRYNAGYLFIQKVYYRLGLHRISRAVAKKHGFDYDLNNILSRIVYARILFPASKLATCELAKRFVEQPTFGVHQVYRALSALSKDEGYIQARLYKNSLRLSKRKTGVVFYDCTNFFYETEQEDSFRRYGVSKEHRPNPVVQMGLFMDHEGIPLAFVMNPGNTNEQVTMTPLEKKLMADFGMSKFVVCTDAGLSSTENRKFNSKEGRSFVTTQSLKKLKKHLREWALAKEGWKLPGKGDAVYNLGEVDGEKHRDSIFYKERWMNEDGFEQHIIVTYSIKTMKYQRGVRNRQIQRALGDLEKPASKVDAKKNTDYKRFLSRKTCTKEGEKATYTFFELDREAIEKEEQYDGFYASCTNLEDDACDIVRINQRRWEIEECFRIMKSEFESRPVYLSREDRIKAHFMTCFIALIIYRYIEKDLKEKFTCDTIIDTLRNMDMVHIEGSGWIPAYTRTDVTDALHEAYGFRTDYEITTPKKMKNICAESKKM